MLPEHPQQLGGLVVEQAGPETLLYHATGQAAGDPSLGGAIHALNPTARLIWDLCDGAHTVAEIETALRAAFEVPADHDLQTDIHRTLAVLLRNGLLQA